MKKWLMIAVAIFTVVAMVGCGKKVDREKPKTKASTQVEKREDTEIAELIRRNKAFEERDAEIESALKERTFVKKLWNDAENGDPCAQFELGRCYFHGIHVDKSEVVAKDWFLKAAKQGHASAMYYYVKCGGEERDDWLLRAVSLENGDAALMLSRDYEYEIQRCDGSERDNYRYLTAKFRFLSAKYGHKYDSPIWSIDRVSGYHNIWKRADFPGADGSYYLGLCFFYGYDCKEVDLYRAKKFFHEAVEYKAEYHMFDACFYLGLIYQHEGNDMESVSWYRTAAKQGHKGAQEALKKMGKTW